MHARIEKVDKAPAKKDGHIYEVIHSIYDTVNGIALDYESVIQTNCAKWAKRMGSMLSEPSNRLPPKFPANEVLLITGCAEDQPGAETPEKTPDDMVTRNEMTRAPEEEIPASNASGGRTFKRRGAAA